MKPLETHGILGQSTSYPKTYAPDMLYPIPRALGRAKLALPADALSIGMDWCTHMYSCLLFVFTCFSLYDFKTNSPFM